MDSFRITLVSQDPAVREAAARAFDSAPRHWSLGLLDSVPADEVGGRVVWGPDVTAPDGASRFDPADPATLAGLAPSAADPTSSTGASFVVTSVAGGAGVSTAALHLTRCLAGMGRKALLLDAGTGWLRERLKLLRIRARPMTSQSPTGLSKSHACRSLVAFGCFWVVVMKPIWRPVFGAPAVSSNARCWIFLQDAP